MSWIRASRPRPIAAAVLAAACLGSGAAAGQTRPGDAAMAETLFNEGKRRMAAGDFAGACPKLAESYRLDAGSGTLTALAVCHEGLGRTASAWTEFIEVVSEAKQAGRPDREKFAQQHIGALEPKLSKLTVVVDPAIGALPDFELRRDGTVIGSAAWGTAAPVDPGEHVVEAKAAGKKRWSSKVTVGASADLQTVTVPPLEDEEGGAAAATGAPDHESAPSATPEDTAASASGRDQGDASRTGRTQRVIGLVIGGAGLVAAGVGTYFGVVAISKSNDANGKCPDAASCPDPGAVSTNHEAKSAAQAADIAFAGAGVALVAGALVYLLAPAAPSQSAAAVAVTPVLSPREGGVFVRARW